MAHIGALGILVALFAMVAGVLADARTPRRLVTVFLVSALFFVALIGLGAVFGKVLGDFLRA